MTTLDRITTGLASWLVAATWQLALMVALVALACWALRRAAPGLRYGLWLLVFIKALTPTSLGGAWAVGEWGVAPVRQALPPAARQAFTPRFGEPSDPRVSDPAPPAEEPQREVAREGSGLPSRPQGPRRERASAAASVVVGVWGAGVVWVAGSVALGYRRMRRAIAALPVAEEGLARVALERAAIAIGIDDLGPIELRLADRPTSPLLVGVLHPVIVLPTTLVDQLTDTQLHGVLAHELMHWRRRDTWVGWLPTLVHTLFWFHPLVWWAGVRLREARECATDDAVLRARASDSDSYGEAIVRSLTIGRGQPVGLAALQGVVGPRVAHGPLAAAGLVGVFERGALLQQRVEEVMSFDPTRGRFGWPSALLLGLFAVVCVPMAGDAAPQAPEEEELVALSLDAPTDATTRVSVDKEVKVEGEGSIRVDTRWPTTVCLAEVEGPDITGAQLVYSAMVKPELDGAASLEMWAHLGGGQYFSRNPSVAVSGSGAFRQLQIPFFFQQGQRPEKVTLNLIVQGKGTVWVDDVKLLKRPLPTAAGAATAEAKSTPPDPTRPPFPIIEKTTPEIGATDVDPATKQIAVRFDRPMGRGMSWTGGGDAYPPVDESREPTWIDSQTCVLPVKLSSGAFYRVGINSKSFQNFRSVDGKPAAHRAIYFATDGAKRSVRRRAEPPAVAKLQPENRATGVDPSLDRITVRFDTEMGGGMSWVRSGGEFPGAEGEPAEWSRDRRSCSLPVDLEPGVTYQLSLNGSHAVNFQSKWGAPLPPIEWTFTTAEE